MALEADFKAAMEETARLTTENSFLRAPRDCSSFPFGPPDLYGAPRAQRPACPPRPRRGAPPYAVAVAVAVGLFHQATLGDCAIQKVMKFVGGLDPGAMPGPRQAKFQEILTIIPSWHEWLKLKGMSKQEAKENFIAQVKQLKEVYEPARD